MKIDINEVKELKESLDVLEENELLFIKENDEEKYVLMNVTLFEQIKDIAKFISEDAAKYANAHPVEDIELSYEEYENIKKQIIDALEKTFLPKPEKLN